ncbi:uncharacterized protein LOC135925012 isoform X3 [Gordionus sp. m RMFG-2023]|uniref:uncharacterized protein LOC135925012 isoform X3 n=1 Tax=Gordionus sp. m RMFG-2023 TaxID=3053472 RepID=UPI0031FC8D0E
MLFKVWQTSCLGLLQLKLESVLGFTTFNNSTLSYNTETRLMSYPSGSILVIHDVQTNKNDYIVTNCKKSISSCSFSTDGNFIVFGECGHQPAIRVWDIRDKIELAQFYSHKYEVACVAFTPDMKYLISIGSHHDMSVNVWDWKNKFKIGCNKISSQVKALSISQDSQYFVTSGNKHVKFWSLTFNLNISNSHSTLDSINSHTTEPIPLIGRSAILGDLRNEIFNDIKCGILGNMDKVYAITNNGILCLFSRPPSRQLEITVDVECETGNCISVSELKVICGCSNGVIRIYDASTLELMTNFPKPYALGISRSLLDPTPFSLNISPKSHLDLTFPDCIACAIDTGTNQAISMYNDHGIYIWDMSNEILDDIRPSWNFFYHSCCVWEILLSSLSLKDDLNQITPLMITCSYDATIRFWTMDSTDKPILTFIIYLHAKYAHSTVYSSTNNKMEIPNNVVSNSHYNSDYGARSLTLSKDGNYLACGDKIGNIRIFETNGLKEVNFIEAHDGEIVTLDFSSLNSEYEEYSQLLASGSKDRLIHIYQKYADINFVISQTLNDHSAPICCVKFICINSESYQNIKVLLLLSCAADKSILVREAITGNRDDLKQKAINFVLLYQITNISCYLYDLDIDAHGKFIVTACQDRNIRIYDVLDGKLKYICKGSPNEEGILIKTVFDPSSQFVAVSCSDKSVNIIDFKTGEIMANINGHSEIVVCFKFSIDGSKIYTATFDGSIYAWKLSSELIKRIQLNLSECQDMNLFISPIYSSILLNKHKENKKYASEKASSPYNFNINHLPSWAQKQVLLTETDQIKPVLLPSTFSKLNPFVKYDNLSSDDMESLSSYSSHLTVNKESQFLNRINFQISNHLPLLPKDNNGRLNYTSPDAIPPIFENTRESLSSKFFLKCSSNINFTKSDTPHSQSGAINMNKLTIIGNNTTKSYLLTEKIRDFKMSQSVSHLNNIKISYENGTNNHLGNFDDLNFKKYFNQQSNDNITVMKRNKANLSLALDRTKNLLNSMQSLVLTPEKQSRHNFSLPIHSIGINTCDEDKSLNHCSHSTARRYSQPLYSQVLVSSSAALINTKRLEYLCTSRRSSKVHMSPRLEALDQEDGIIMSDHNKWKSMVSLMRSDNHHCDLEQSHTHLDRYKSHQSLHSTLHAPLLSRTKCLNKSPSFKDLLHIATNLSPNIACLINKNDKRDYNIPPNFDPNRYTSIFNLNKQNQDLNLNCDNGNEISDFHTSLPNLNNRTSPDGIMSAIEEPCKIQIHENHQLIQMLLQIKHPLKELGKTINCTKIIKNVESQMSLIHDKIYNNHQNKCIHDNVLILIQSLLMIELEAKSHFKAVFDILEMLCKGCAYSSTIPFSTHLSSESCDSTIKLIRSYMNELKTLNQSILNTCDNIFD